MTSIGTDRQQNKEPDSIESTRMIGVQKRKSPCQAATSTKLTTTLDGQTKSQARAKRAKFSASKSNQAQHQQARQVCQATAVQQESQAGVEDPVWIFGLINNIEQLLSTFTAANGNAAANCKRVGGTSASSGSSTPSSMSSSFSAAPSPPSASSSFNSDSSASSPYSSSCSSSLLSASSFASSTAQTSSAISSLASTASLPKSPISRQIKFHEYKGPPSAKRQQTSAKQQQLQMQQPSNKNQQQQHSLPTACRGAAGSEAPAQQLQLQQQPQRQRLASSSVTYPHLMPVQSTTHTFEQQQRSHPQSAKTLTSGPQYNSANSQQQQLAFYAVDPRQADQERQQQQQLDRPPMQMSAALILAQPYGDTTASRSMSQTNATAQTQQQQSTNNVLNTMRIQLQQQHQQQHLHPAFGESQQQHQSFNLPVYHHQAGLRFGGNECYLPAELMSSMIVNDAATPTATMSSFNDTRASSMQQSSCSGLVDSILGVNKDFGSGSEETDACEIEPTISFSQEVDDELLFSEFIDLQDVPMNVDESDWLKKFLPPCSLG